ncbi:hypothetical protein LCGC14_0815000 [marine sediment metagenome]|uniref:Uncharacterized protein n=1 Tax=marine sediment metagenome TaxID=412755 RepID=A0A0F9PKL8_9ZZZZ
MKVIKVVYFVISLPVVLLGITYWLTRLDFAFGKKIALELWGQIR